MHTQHKVLKSSGFTIVELLIVIVVIAILAAIGIVAYSGIQERAKNSQTQQALTAWIKALQLYKAENGRWPGGYSCLGEGYKFGPSGNDMSGVGQCRQDAVADGALENATFKTTMSKYLSAPLPTPAFVTAKSSDTLWRRGLTYLYGGGSGNLVYIDAAFAGQGDCPVVAGFSASGTNLWGGNRHCMYTIGFTTDT